VWRRFELYQKAIAHERRWRNVSVEEFQNALDLQASELHATDDTRVRAATPLHFYTIEPKANSGVEAAATLRFYCSAKWFHNQQTLANKVFAWEKETIVRRTMTAADLISALTPASRAAAAAAASAETAQQAVAATPRTHHILDIAKMQSLWPDVESEAPGTYRLVEVEMEVILHWSAN
jgi:hypothetical protein